ncbi:MAG TPA: hypothetical protein VLL04_11565, partial [Rhizomicrobium sp.]|nr:hypothetical protein [Rhizomicrobium sp.]
MKTQNFALAALALGLMTSAAFGQASRLAIQGEPARDGTPGWHLGASFPDPTGFTLVEPGGTVNVIPREQRGQQARVPGGD